MKTSIARALVTLLIVMIGLEAGAGLYEARVVVPTWSGDPQAAYRFWNANPQFEEHAGERWWMFSTPLTGLVALAAVLFAGRLPRGQAPLVRIAGLATVGMTVITFAYFVPTLLQLRGPDVLSLTPSQAQGKAALWGAFNWVVRAPVYVTAWLITIRAASLGSAKQ